MMKYFFGVLILIFCYFIGVQYNDPDPIIWMILYFIPIVLIVEKNSKKNISKKYFIIIGVLYALWATNQFPKEWEGVMLNKMGMKTKNIELGRESLGLAFTSLIIFILVLLPAKK